MLTGRESGGFAAKLAEASENRHAAALDQIRRIVDAWELSVAPLTGSDYVTKAEEIVSLVQSY
jgi:hypothetical protein